MSEAQTALAQLESVLENCAPAAIAVSGGVDSMTLAWVAGRALGDAATMYHAVSPAVPAAATARVRRHAGSAGWRLEVVDAGEFSDARYLANPAERCFFCKTHLYDTLAVASGVQLLSGTNLDDLGDWRPGLRAAAARAVRHPFVEAGIDKATVRAIARLLALDDLAELPAAPCLSSRVETGIPIAPRALAFIERAEDLLREALAPQTVRCRVRREGVVIELDEITLAATSDSARGALAASLRPLADAAALDGPIRFAPYARGSAFLRDA